MLNINEYIHVQGTGYYVSPPIDQYLKFKNHCSLVHMEQEYVHAFLLLLELAPILKAGVLKKLNLGGLAKLSRLRYSWLRFALASAGYLGLGVYNRSVYTAG